MGDVDVLQAAAIEVGGVNAHAGFIAAVFAGGDAGDEGDILKGAVVLVEEKKIRPGVVGDGDIGPAIVVEVRGDHSHAFSFGLADAAGIADVGESAVVVVVIELDVLAFVVAGMAI